MKIKEKLEEVISLKLEEAKNSDSEKCKNAVDDAAKLTDRLIEIKKMEAAEHGSNEYIYYRILQLTYNKLVPLYRNVY